MNIHAKIKPISFILAILLSHQTWANNKQDCQDGEWKNGICEERIDNITVTATKTPFDLSKYAGQVGILHTTDFLGNERIMDTLSAIPGFETGGDSGRNIGAQYTIRGFGYQSENRVIIRQDGVPRAPSLFSNHISSFRTDPDILKRTEVIKGASSILYGSGAIGGIVSMRTKQASDYLRPNQQYGAMIGSRVESNNMNSIRGAFYAKPKIIPFDILLYSKRALFDHITLSGNGYYSDTKKAYVNRIDNQEAVNTHFIKFGWDISDKQRATLSYFNYDEKLDTTWQTLYHSEYGDSPVRGRLKQKDLVFDYRYTPENDWLDLSLKAYRSEASYFRHLESKSKKETIFVDYENSDKRYGFSAENRAHFKTGIFNHELLTGLDYQNRQENAIYTRNGTFSDFGSFPNEYQDWGLFIQDNIRYRKWLLTLGGRYDYFNRQINRSGSQKYADNRFSPRIAVAYEPISGINLLAGYAESFRAPSPHETSSAGALNPHYYYLPNPNLTAETAKEFEFGFAIDKKNLLLDNDALIAKATYFTGDIDNMIGLKALPERGKPPESNQYGQYQNIEEAKRKGYEISLKYDFKGLQLNTSFEHLKMYDKNSGNQLIQAFADKLSAGIAYRHQPSGLQIGLQVNHWFKPKQNPEGKTFRGKFYPYVNKKFTQVHIKGLWQPKNTGYRFFDHNTTVAFGINNLFNQRYTNARDYLDTSRVGKGRNFYLDLEKRF